MNQIVEIISTIRRNKDNWNIRVTKLEKLQQMIQDDQSYPWTPEILARKVAPVVATQLRDLRSSVVREASRVVMCFATILREDAKPLSRAIVPALIDQMGCGNCVIISYVEEAFLDYVKYVHARCIIPKITDIVLKSRNKDLRSKCMNLLTIALLHFERQELKRHTEIIYSAIKAGLADACSVARARSREAFCTFQLHFPILANDMLPFIGERTRLMLKEMIHDDGGSDEIVDLDASSESISTLSTPTSNDRTPNQRTPRKVDIDYKSRRRLGKGAGNYDGRDIEYLQHSPSPPTPPPQQTSSLQSPDKTKSKLKSIDDVEMAHHILVSHRKHIDDVLQALSKEMKSLAMLERDILDDKNDGKTEDIVQSYIQDVKKSLKKRYTLQCELRKLIFH
eukprot:g1198.t1